MLDPFLLPPLRSSLVRNSGGTVGMYFLSRSLFIPPNPAPYVMSMSVEVGNWNGSIYDGSRSNSSGASCSASYSVDGAGEAAGRGCAVALIGVEGVSGCPLCEGLGDLPRAALRSAAAFCIPRM